VRRGRGGEGGRGREGGDVNEGGSGEGYSRERGVSGVRMGWGGEREHGFGNIVCTQCSHPMFRAKEVPIALITHIEWVHFSSGATFGVTGCVSISHVPCNSAQANEIESGEMHCYILRVIGLSETGPWRRLVPTKGYWVY
jgi:hypothetical protein